MGEVHINSDVNHYESKLNGSAIKKATVADSKNSSRRCLWFEEEIEEDLRWVFSVSKILHTGVSDYQDITLLESGPFGKVLILDGKLQSADADEFVYHEALVHPALLYHSNPKSIFIMGGGEGSTAREALKHRSVKKVVMCDIDKEVVDFCKAYLISNREAFKSNRLQLLINDARAELEEREDKFDVIIGDLADPVEGGPCYQLYTQSFYENILKPRLALGGILVTQAGPAGILSHEEVYSSIYNTLRQVFKYVIPYAAHVPSYSDSWGWVMASDEPLPKFSIEETDIRISQRVIGDLCFLDGETLGATLALNKVVRRSLAKETHIYTEETARFVHGHGTAQKLISK
ncbi:hypothetical protein O6H91_01G029800 [Diphasiastrum complanatum]|uniref:Uncharacterized protein n=1 Tax=Diphasiastrum complanatum TaxID=34168 RepID=A0ACC2EPG7_DIPCM|nr:hypothetical protein O6H91_Y098500 [Diphasiastrum complanatum]KAJ7568376.1 hypothetical protein O6H91_01G029800 [Diphasiastrum complanatum]